MIPFVLSSLLKPHLVSDALEELIPAGYIFASVRAMVLRWAMVLYWRLNKCRQVPHAADGIQPLRTSNILARLVLGIPLCHAAIGRCSSPITRIAWCMFRRRWEAHRLGVFTAANLRVSMSSRKAQASTEKLPGPDTVALGLGLCLSAPGPGRPPPKRQGSWALARRGSRESLVSRGARRRLCLPSTLRIGRDPLEATRTGWIRKGSCTPAMRSGQQVLEKAN